MASVFGILTLIVCANASLLSYYSRDPSYSFFGQSRFDPTYTLVFCIVGILALASLALGVLDSIRPGVVIGRAIVSLLALAAMALVGAGVEAVSHQFRQRTEAPRFDESRDVNREILNVLAAHVESENTDLRNQVLMCQTNDDLSQLIDREKSAFSKLDVGREMKAAFPFVVRLNRGEFWLALADGTAMEGPESDFIQFLDHRGQPVGAERAAIASVVVGAWKLNRVGNGHVSVKNGHGRLSLPSCLNFGFVRPNSRVAGAVRLANIGTSINEIVAVRPSCGCTTTALPQDKKVVKPGDVVEIEASMVVGSGSQRHYISLVLKDQSSQKTSTFQVPVFTAQVDSLTVVPETLDWGVVKLGNIESRTLRLSERRADRFEIISVISENLPLVANVEEKRRSDGLRDWLVTLQLGDMSQWQHPSHPIELKIHTSSALKPIVQIPMSVNQ